MFLTGLKLQARVAARRAGFTLVGCLFLLIGVAFLTVAAWIALAEMSGALTAALVIGGCYVGLGLIFFALSMRRVTRVPVEAPPLGAAGPGMAGFALPALIEAFGMGIAAGLANRRRRPREPR